MYTIIRIHADGRYSGINLDTYTEAKNAYYTALLYNEDECFLGLFEKADLIYKNKEERGELKCW